MANSKERVPGLNCPVTADTVNKSRKIHDLLSKNTDRPPSEAHLSNLKNILVNYNVHDKYGFHKPHRHLDGLGENRIFIGTTLTKPLCRLTRAQHIDDVDLDDIHAHLLVFYSIHSALVLTVLALGKACLHRDNVPDVVHPTDPLPHGSPAIRNGAVLQSPS
ncbi:hypothetical protein FHETE_10408 [Fusarium heterosporum]|uniref:Uncharacterized protein n=1 Tax=Fusarium heterosporum TaxID=42747 RepID=A0A8H5SPJ4_FUSHE|nr:hypothetical protein FHETE_10408 [Fusarium heterosporum]